MRRSLSSAALSWCAVAVLAAGCASAVKSPTVNAKVPATAAVGVWIQLDGSASVDPNSPVLPLNFVWSLTQAPAGSTAAIENPSAIKPSFKPDVVGDYSVRLAVTNGLRSAVVDSKLTAGPCGAQPPGFLAGTVKATPAAPATGQVVVLAAEATDADNAAACGLPAPQLLTVQWAIVSKPLTSQAALLNERSPIPSFIPDQPGDYVLHVVVTDSTGLSSGQDLTVTANACGGNPPVITEIDPSLAKPAVGTPLRLSAIVTDADNGAACATLGVAMQDVTYAWSIRSTPLGSRATLSSLTAKDPSFTPDVAGDYLVRLTVTDSTARVSVPVDMTVTAATCGPQLTPPTFAPTTPKVGDGVSVKATPTSSCPSSDPSAAAFAYAWTVSAAPAGAHPTLSDATLETANFVADLPGSYTLHLVVADGDNRASTTDVTVPVSGYSCGTNIPSVTSVTVNPATPGVGASTQLTANVSDADNDPAGCHLTQTFTYAWSVVNLPAGSKTTLNGATLAQPSLVTDVPGTYQLAVAATDSTGRSSASFPFVVTVGTCGTNPPVIDSITGAPASTIAPGTPVALQATAHDDDNGAACAANGVPTQTLASSWRLTAWPAGSTVRIQGQNTLTPSFTPDLAGGYAAQLTVTDSTNRSTTSSVTVTVNACGTNAPVISAVTTSPSAPTINRPVTLTATATDPDNTSSCGLNQALNYQWSLQAAPAGSTASFARGAGGPTATFTPDVTGAYTFDVVVSDTTGRSATMTTTVNAGTCSPPVAKIGVQSPLTLASASTVGPFTLLKDAVLWFDGSSSTASSCMPAGTTVQYSWSPVSLPPGAPGNGGLNSSNIVNPSTGALSAPGRYVYQLVVSDAAGVSAPATLTVDIQGTVPGTTVGIGNVSVSMALDPTTGRPAYAYYDQTQNAVSVAFCTANCNTTSATFRIETVASSLGSLSAGQLPMRGVSFAFTSAGTAEVAYYEQSKCTFAFAWRNGSGSWTTKDLVASPGTMCGNDGLGGGGAFNNSFGRDLSLALRNDDLPGIAFLLHNRITNSDSLQYVECTDVATKCQTASPQFGAAQTATASNGQRVGYMPSLKFSSQNQPRVATYNRDLAVLQYSFCDAACATAGWPAANTVSADNNVLSGDVGRLPSLALNATDNPRISYTDAQNNRVGYALCDGNCGAQGSWTQQVVDQNQGDFTSLALDAQGTPYIAYTDAPNGGGALMLAILQNQQWTRLTVDSSHSYFYTSIVLTAGPIAHIAYGDGTIGNRQTKSYFSAFGL